MPRSSKCSLAFRLSNKNRLFNSHLSCACYIPRPSHCPSFKNLNEIWRCLISSLLSLHHSSAQISFSACSYKHPYASSKSNTLAPHAMDTLVGRGGTASTHSWPLHSTGRVVRVTPRPRFTARERTPPPLIGCVGLRSGLDTEARGKILLPLPGIEPRSPVRPVRSQTLHCLSYPCFLIKTVTEFKITSYIAIRALKFHFTNLYEDYTFVRYYAA
jgi:hypothetical protein